MITDAETRFFDKAAFDAASDIINVGKGDAGRGEPLYLFVNINGGAAASGLTVALNTSPNADMSSPEKIGERVIPAAAVTAGGLVFKAPLPTGCRKYLQLAMTGLTAGTVSAGLVLGVDDKPLISDWTD